MEEHTATSHESLSVVPASASTLAEIWEAHSGLGSMNTSEAVYQTLREAIATGTFAPGDHLNESAIAETLKISRTPIREALLRLETERLLERSSGRRLTVTEVTLEEILDVYVIREVINGLAARLAAENAHAGDLVRLRRLHREMRWALEEGDTAGMATRNFQFHEALCKASRNAFLLTILRQAHDTQRRFPGTTFSLPERAAESVAEHEAILEAVAAHDGVRAEELARRHMANTKAARISMLDGTVDEHLRRLRSKPPVPEALDA